MKTEETFAEYCGQSVIVLDTESTVHGVLCLISFDDGREDWVPMVCLNFLD